VITARFFVTKPELNGNDLLNEIITLLGRYRNYHLKPATLTSLGNNSYRARLQAGSLGQQKIWLASNVQEDDQTFDVLVRCHMSNAQAARKLAADISQLLRDTGHEIGKITTEPT